MSVPTYDEAAYEKRILATPWSGLVFEQPHHPMHDDVPHQTGSKFDLARCREVLKGLAAGGHGLLDVGSGDGWTTRQFMDMGLDAHGVTISRRDVAEAATRGLGDRIHLGDMHLLPWPAGTFRFIWCRHALEHAIAPLLALLEFRRVLGPHQWLFVGMPLESGPWVDVAPHHWVPTRKQALATFKKGGFRVESEWTQDHGTGQQSYLLRKK